MSAKGNLGIWETTLFYDRKAGEWIHLSEEGDVCFKCGAIGPFVWVDSEYKYEDNRNRCELKDEQQSNG